MRYFLDTEYNGFRGGLISLGLVPEFGDDEFYCTLPLPTELHPWVERNVIPYLHMVPPVLDIELTPHQAGDELARYLSHDAHPHIIADWPDDISYFCSLLTPESGEMVNLGSIDFSLLRRPGFSTAANSRVPHNALHDARSLRAFVLEEDTFG